MHILLIEDDEILGDGLCTVLMQNGHMVEWMKDAESATVIDQQTGYDFILLDLNLPGMSGFDLLQQMRADGCVTPVLVTTARSAVPDLVRALDQGADDYLVKPFDMAELLARIRAVHRRSQGQPPLSLGHAGLVLDIDRHRVVLQGNPIDLSVREFNLLQALMENPGRVLTRRRLEELLYGGAEEVASNAIEVHIHHLRRKLGPNMIKTVRGVGYVMGRVDR